MINVHIDEAKTELRVTGHAFFAPEGRDIVCAAASVLAYTAAETAGRFYRQKALKAPPEIVLEKGDALIRAVPKQTKSRLFRSAMDAIVTGFELLGKTYPDFVTITKKTEEHA